MSGYLKCSKCGKVVSSVIPGGAERVTIRAWIECPECIAAQPDVEQRIAEAVAAEREACRLLCNAIAMREAQYEPPGDIPQAFVTARVRIANECAAAIRARTGEKVEVRR
ncbi:MAG TPA: hypothetical protein VM537_01090 [Anaerolineae bacterium]|nr:hypothetical protein [Anaerolineae bacterium]